MGLFKKCMGAIDREYRNPSIGMWRFEKVPPLPPTRMNVLMYSIRGLADGAPIHEGPG